MSLRSSLNSKSSHNNKLVLQPNYYNSPKYRSSTIDHNIDDRNQTYAKHYHYDKRKEEKYSFNPDFIYSVNSPNNNNYNRSNNLVNQFSSNHNNSLNKHTLNFLSSSTLNRSLISGTSSSYTNSENVYNRRPQSSNPNNRTLIDYSKTFLPNKTMRKQKTLVLDLDETLVHSSKNPLLRPADLQLNIFMDNAYHQIYVLVRPGALEFLREMSKYYELYADAVVNQLDYCNVISHRLYRDHCTVQFGSLIKELKRLGRDLKDVIIIDNNPPSYCNDKNNGIPIKSWFEDKYDDELFQLQPILKYMAEVEDVRHYIPNFVRNNQISYHLIEKIIKNEMNFERNYNNNGNNRNELEEYNNNRNGIGNDYGLSRLKKRTNTATTNININIVQNMQETPIMKSASNKLNNGEGVKINNYLKPTLSFIGSYGSKPSTNNNENYERNEKIYKGNSSLNGEIRDKERKYDDKVYNNGSYTSKDKERKVFKSSLSNEFRKNYFDKEDRENENNDKNDERQLYNDNYVFNRKDLFKSEIRNHKEASTTITTAPKKYFGFTSENKPYILQRENDSQNERERERERLNNDDIFFKHQSYFDRFSDKAQAHVREKETIPARPNSSLATTSKSKSLPGTASSTPKTILKSANNNINLGSTLTKGLSSTLRSSLYNTKNEILKQSNSNNSRLFNYDTEKATTNRFSLSMTREYNTASGFYPKTDKARMTSGYRTLSGPMRPLASSSSNTRTTVDMSKTFLRPSNSFMSPKRQFF